MKAIRTLTLLAAILAAPLWARAAEPIHTTQPAPAPAAVEAAKEKDWSVAAGFDLWSEYIFRGVDLSGNDVMFNPSASVSWKGFTAYYWGAFNDADPGRWNEETDLGIEYSHDFFDGKLTLTGGAVWYLYFDGDAGTDTVELYGKAIWNVLLSPYVTLYSDIDEFHGSYLSFGVSHSFDLSEKLGLTNGKTLSIDPSAQFSVDLAYNSTVGQSNVRPNDLLFGVKVPFGITENISVHACLQVSVALDALHSIGQGNELIGNVGVAFSF